MPTAHTLPFDGVTTSAGTPLARDAANSTVAENAPSRSGRPARGAPRFEHYFSHAFLQAGPVVFATLVLGVIITAWVVRNEGYLTAETGTGYWLGIAGAVTMAMLLLYPLRKRSKFLSRAGRVANWFRVHMILGIAGPVLVILHTNFKLGSLNSRLALLTMLVVVVSGIIGRYLYAKVHKGLYGSQAELRDILGDLAILKSALDSKLGGDETFERELAAYAPSADAPRTLGTRLMQAISSRGRTGKSRRRLMREARRQLNTSQKFSHWSASQRRQHLKSIDSHLRVFFAAVRKAERLAFFERLFALWHHLHVPLFTLLLLTVTIHVFAVHRY